MKKFYHYIQNYLSMILEEVNKVNLHCKIGILDISHPINNNTF